MFEEETAIDLARMVEEKNPEVTDLETEINIEIAWTTESPDVHPKANLSTTGLKEAAERAEVMEVMEVMEENEAITGSRPGGPITT